MFSFNMFGNIVWTPATVKVQWLFKFIYNLSYSRWQTQWYNPPFKWMKLEKLSLRGHDKLLCLDGFSLTFLPENWNFLKEDLEWDYKEFFGSRVLDNSLNKTLVCLIPWRIEQIWLWTLGPLVRWPLFKFMAKMLANRLEKTSLWWSWTSIVSSLSGYKS